MKMSRTCYMCEYVQDVEFTDISDAISLAEIIGEAYGRDNIDILFDKNWDNDIKKAVAGKGNNDFSIKLYIKPNTCPNGIYIKGSGYSSVEVYVKYRGESTYSLISITAFSSEPSLSFLDGQEISEILLKMPHDGGDGTEIWQEIAIVKIPKV